MIEAPNVTDLGRRPFDPVYEEMQRIAAAVRNGDPGRILLVEHEPVYTAGRATPEDQLHEGIRAIERGGKITYHGPGQLVVYPIVRLPARDVRAWLRALEAFGVEVCARFALAATPSVELCGGTHVDRTGDIGVFKITSEGGIASGVRRIEAVTGKGALDWIDTRERTLADLAGLLRSQPDQAAIKVEQLLKRNKELEKELDDSILQRIHRSTIINITQVKEMESHINGEYFLTLNSGHRVKLSRTYKDKLKLFR